MTKGQYYWLLQTPQWKKKREKILKRDRHRCQKCQSRDNLHVHHIWYIEGKKPWQVPDEYLITLCEICHTNEHKDRNIITFIKKTRVKKKPSIKKSNKKQ